MRTAGRALTALSIGAFVVPQSIRVINAMHALDPCQRTEQDVVRFPIEEGIATPTTHSADRMHQAGAISVPRPRTRQPLGPRLKGGAVAWPQSHPSEAMGRLGNWGGGGDSRAGEGPVMSAKGHRKGAGKAASVVSIAGSEANGTTFEGLYRAYYRALVSYAGKLVGPHNAEDVVQEAFRSCWEEIDGEGIPGDIVARLRRRTSLRSLDLRRKLSHWESWDPAAFEAVALGLAPDALRKRELLEELIERVPEPELKRLIGHLWIGLTHAEIAEVERLSKRTVKRRWAALKKEMRALKKMIGPFRTSETTIRVST
jgi:RNA polymerase sigma factor (sigma-70 family)